MSANPNVVPGSSGGVYKFIKANLTTPRTTYGIDLIPYITDLEVFEHLDKPYLTAKLIIVDTQTIVSSFDIIGGELISIEIESGSGRNTNIKKNFYITEIEFLKKLNQETELTGFHLIEETAYISNLISISKSYKGTSHDIITQIAQEYLKVPIFTNTNNSTATGVPLDYQKTFKALIPYLNPIEAMSWIKNKATNKNGMPFFLFSSFSDNAYPLHFEDLGSLMKQDVLNKDIAYTIWNGGNYQPNPKSKTAQILHHEFGNANSLFKLIKLGAIGADYNYINTFTGSIHKFKLNIDKNILKNYVNEVYEKQTLEEYKGTFPYDSRFKLNNKSYNEISSKTFSKITSSGAFNVGAGSSISYDEEELPNDYNKKATSRALNLLLSSAPLNIVINGNGFIDGSTNTCVGRKIKIECEKPAMNGGRSFKRNLDPKRSGDFLIFSARHMFKSEGNYHISATCVKIGNDAV